MKYRIQLLLLLLTAGMAGGLPLAAQEGNKTGVSLGDLILSLEGNNGDYRSNEAAGRMDLNDYLIARANLLPSIKGSLPLSYTGLNEENYSSSVDRQKTRNLSGGAGLSLTQLLPTAGVLSAEITGQLSSDTLVDMSPYALPLPADPILSANLQLSAGISQPLYFGNAYRAARSIIQETYDAGCNEVLDSRNRLIRTVLEDYYRIQQARFSRDLIRVRLEGDTESYQRVEAEYEMGLWTKSVLYQTLSARLQSESDLLEAEQNRETLERAFQARYGLSLPEGNTGTVQLFPREELSEETLLPRILARNPQTLRLNSQAEICRAGLVTARKDQAPTVSLGSSWTRNTGLGDSDLLYDSLTLSLEFSASLYGGGRDRRTLQNRQEEILQAESALTDWNIQLESQVRSLLAALERSEQRARLLELKVEAATYEFQKGEVDLEMGKITKKDLSEQRLALEKALLDRQENIISANNTYLQLLSLEGRDLRELPFIGKEL